MILKSLKYAVTTACAIFYFFGILQIADGKPGKKSKTKDENQIIAFLKENGIDLKKKVIAIQVTGNERAGNSQIAVMKLISINDQFENKKPVTKAEKTAAAFLKGANKYSADIIKTVIVSIVDGIVVEDGETAKVADVVVFLEDSSSFNVVVGEDFSQIVFEKIISKPENPFSKEPVEKSVKTLSFTSPDLLKSVLSILEPKRE